MKLIYPELSSAIIEEGRQSICTEFIIESPELFSKYLSELLLQINGEEGNYVLVEEDKELDISKYVEVVVDPFSVDFNNRKILTRLYSELSKIAYEDDNYLCTQEIMADIQKYLIKLEQTSNFMLNINDEIDVSGLFKTFNIKFEDYSDNYCDKLIQYIKILSELLNTKIFVLVNAHSFFTNEQIQEIILSASYNDVFILLIENQQKYCSGRDIHTIIIDIDGCEVC